MKRLLLGLATLIPASLASLHAAESSPTLLADYAWKPFAPVDRPVPPAAAKREWLRNPIDAFIAAGHASRELQARPEASREMLLRRVSLDLTGLPPTPAERRAFLDDASPQAYEKVVDRLLDARHYGERWGRHWMDIWRYADRDLKTNGDGLEIPAHMWRWRDWIIESLNADKGYDLMLRQMLAGDELAPADRDALRATAYLARNKAKSRDVWMQETVDHALQAFTGITIQCARCHDHPVDPIKQLEYYRLRAVFEPTGIRIDPFEPGGDVKTAGLARAYDANTHPTTRLYIRGNPLKPDPEPVLPGVPAMLQGPELDVQSVNQGASTGRRLALARWLSRPEHPTTARVAVNHIWARHFGRGLVPSMNDFGAGGQAPSHPALLDWLAAEFTAQDWKMKPLHRLIVTSSTYRMSSTPAKDQLARDPDNHFLWRFSPRRVEAEAVRDAVLQLSGRLDLKLGGPNLEPDAGGETFRRSLYYRSGPNTQAVFLKTFDGTVAQECYQRRSSIQPSQALALLNSRLVLQGARRLARRLSGEAGAGSGSGPFIEQAFHTVLARSATEAERRICAEFLQELASVHAGKESSGTTDADELDRPAARPELRARENLVQILFNHHEFVTLR